MKKCSSCKKYFDLSNFYSNGKKLRTACKDCERKRIRKYNTDKNKKRVLNLPNAYIKTLLKLKNPTKELIELKRLELKLKRECKKWKTTKNT